MNMAATVMSANYFKPLEAKRELDNNARVFS